MQLLFSSLQIYYEFKPNLIKFREIFHLSVNAFIDLKTLLPYDLPAIVSSVERTGRLAIIHEAPQTMGFGAEIAAAVQAEALGYLEAPIDRICAPDVPYSYRVGDDYYIPNEARIRAGLIKTMEYQF